MQFHKHYLSYCLINTVTVAIFFISDPKQWPEAHVRLWVQWVIKDFSLEGINAQDFTMTGLELINMGREAFLARTPPFMGDILWQHLEFLQKGKDLGTLGRLLGNSPYGAV